MINRGNLKLLTRVNNLKMSSYKEKMRKIQEEEKKAKEVTSVIVQFQTADVNGIESC